MTTLYELLSELEGDTLLLDMRTLNRLWVEDLLASGDSCLTEPATMLHNEIFFASESGEIIDITEPAYTIMI